MPAPQERDLNKATEDFKNWLINEKDQDASIAVEVYWVDLKILVFQTKL